MRIILSLFIVSCLLSASCSSQQSGKGNTTKSTNIGNITDNEDKGIKEIISIYGGEYEYGYAKSVGFNSDSKMAFWLEVRKSEGVEDFKVDPKLLTSNMAFLFYRNLKEEKKKYNEIQVKIIKNNGEHIEDAYSASDLEIVTNRFNVINQVFSLIKNKDFASLKDHIILDPENGVANSDDMIDDIKSLEAKLGKIEELSPFGFRFIRSERGQEGLYFAGILMRENENHPFSAVLNPNSKENKVYFINYKL